jgi:hypothetical protein
VLVLCLLLAGLGPARAGAEVVWLRNGDRLTGTIVSETAKSVRLKLPFATLLIPKSRIERLVRADGKEEVLHAAAPVGTVAAPAPPAVPMARLVLVVTGASFWQAWDRKEPPADPSLRLQVRLDEEPVATWVDSTLDPEDLPGALVNTFAFTTGDEAGVAAPGVLLSPPEVQPGRVVLRASVPRAAGPGRHVRVSYQVNEGSEGTPVWRDLATATAVAAISAAEPTLLQVRQDRGLMSYTKKRMRDVETFRIEIGPE